VRIYEGLADAAPHRLEGEHQEDHEILVGLGVATNGLDLGLEEALLLAGVLHLVDPSPFLEKAPHLLAVGQSLKFDYPADQCRSLRVVRLERLAARRDERELAAVNHLSLLLLAHSTLA
jgi:hypothetical protein